MRLSSAFAIALLATPVFAGPREREIRTDARDDARASWTETLRERLKDSPELREDLPEIADVDLKHSGDPKIETLLDRLESGPAAPDSPSERDALILKTVSSIKDPILKLADKARAPETPSNVLLGMAFKLRWQLLKEGVYFSDAERASIDRSIAAARNRLTYAENARFEDAMRAFDAPAGSAGIPTAPMVAGLRKLSPDVPYLEKRFYDPAAAASLGITPSRTIVWDLNHTGEDHKDPYHENIRLRPDFVAALKFASQQGFNNVIMTQAEQWWVDPFFGMFPTVRDYVHGVIVAENYMDMTGQEKRMHPEAARLLADRPTGKYIPAIGARIIIDEDKSNKLRGLASEAGFRHIVVPPAFSGPMEGHILERAVEDAINHLDSQDAPARRALSRFLWRMTMATILFVSFVFVFLILSAFFHPPLGLFPSFDWIDRLHH